MVLVYNLRDPSQIYERYAGVQGSAYFVGGVGIQYQTHGNVTLAPIRSGIGLRLGANVGYLKYTRSPRGIRFESPCGFRIKPGPDKRGMKALRTQLASRIIRPRKLGLPACEVLALREVAQSRTQA